MRRQRIGSWGRCSASIVTGLRPRRGRRQDDPRPRGILGDPPPGSARPPDGPGGGPSSRRSITGLSSSRLLNRSLRPSRTRSTTAPPAPSRRTRTTKLDPGGPDRASGLSRGMRPMPASMRTRHYRIGRGWRRPKAIFALPHTSFRRRRRFSTMSSFTVSKQPRIRRPRRESSVAPDQPTRH